jgi:hypothetical protein
MRFETLTIEDLKRDYTGRHGFVFVGNSPSNRDGCNKISDAIIQRKICDVPVEFIVELNPTSFVFVYPEDCSFNSPYLYQISTHLSQMMGVFKIDTLMAFLKQN